MDYNARIFAFRLKIAREKKNLSLKELREKCAVSSAAMSNYANGKSIPQLDTAFKIAQELGVSLDWLCGINNDPMDISTIGDLARHMKAILDIQNNNKTATYIESEIYYDAEPVVNRTEIFIDNAEIYQLFIKMDKLKEIANGSPEEKEVFKVWFEKQLERLDKIDCNDELPF